MADKKITIILLSFFLLLTCVIQLDAQDRPIKKPRKNNPVTSQPQTTQPSPNQMISESDTSEIVNLDKAEEIEMFREGDEEIRFLKGGVVMSQDDAVFYCDSAYMYTIQNAVLAWKEVAIVQMDTVSAFSDTLKYFGDTKDSYMIGNVVLSDTHQKLFTQRLDYNLDSKIAKYFHGGLIKNKDTQLTSEECIYNTDTKDAFFKDSVLVINDEFTLKADSLNYNTETQFSEFIGPTLIFQDSAKIYCEAGFYDYEENYAEFKNRPQYIKGDRIAISDFMKYDGELNKVFLEGNAVFRENEKYATADRIVYDEEKDETRLEGNAYFKDDENEINSDVIIYDGKTESYSTEGKTIASSGEEYIEANNSSYDNLTETTTLTGNVYLSDTEQILQTDELEFNEKTGDAFASGNVYWQDTINQITIRSDDLYFNQDADYVKAIGRPIMTSIMDGDTLYLSADTLISEKIPIENSDSIEILRAYRDVRIFKKDFQAVCDSMVYNVTDSLFVFYQHPILWSDSTQFTADTISFILKNEKIDSVFLKGNGLIVDTPDERFFNQIGGRNIIVDFENNQPFTMHVNGNAESVFYVQDDDGGYVGPNKTTCSFMDLFFDDGDLVNVKFYVQPTSSLIPMNDADHRTLQLKGFSWEKNKRPFSPADLNSHHYIVSLPRKLKITK